MVIWSGSCKNYVEYFKQGNIFLLFLRERKNYNIGTVLPAATNIFPRLDKVQECSARDLCFHPRGSRGYIGFSVGNMNFMIINYDCDKKIEFFLLIILFPLLPQCINQCISTYAYLSTYSCCFVIIGEGFFCSFNLVTYLINLQYLVNWGPFVSVLPISVSASSFFSFPSVVHVGYLWDLEI